MTTQCEDQGKGECAGAVLAYALDELECELGVAVLCEAHSVARPNVTIRAWGRVAFSAERVEEISRQIRMHKEAKASFVQRYDDRDQCFLGQRGACTGCTIGVASYYFSDGGTLPLCEEHEKESGALMSVQYYDEVYGKQLALSDVWRHAFQESRRTAEGR